MNIHPAGHGFVSKTGLAFFVSTFVAVSVFLLAPFLLVKPSYTQPYQEVQKIEPETSFEPETISIPSVGLEMSVYKAKVNGNEWEIFEGAVSWLEDSGDLQSGNVIMYGHNDKEAFGKIIRLGKGAVVELKNSTAVKRYEVVRAYETKSTDLTQIHTPDDQLTLYTCSGWFDAKRYFVIAKPVE